MGPEEGKPSDPRVKIRPLTNLSGLGVLDWGIDFGTGFLSLWVEGFSFDVVARGLVVLSLEALDLAVSFLLAILAVLGQVALRVVLASFVIIVASASSSSRGPSVLVSGELLVDQGVNGLDRGWGEFSIQWSISHQLDSSGSARGDSNRNWSRQGAAW